MTSESYSIVTGLEPRKGESIRPLQLQSDFLNYVKKIIKNVFILFIATNTEVKMTIFFVNVPHHRLSDHWKPLNHLIHSRPQCSEMLRGCLCYVCHCSIPCECFCVCVCVCVCTCVLVSCAWAHKMKIMMGLWSQTYENKNTHNTPLMEIYTG